MSFQKLLYVYLVYVASIYCTNHKTDGPSHLCPEGVGSIFSKKDLKFRFDWPKSNSSLPQSILN